MLATFYITMSKTQSLSTVRELSCPVLQRTVNSRGGYILLPYDNMTDSIFTSTIKFPLFKLPHKTLTYMSLYVYHILAYICIYIYMDRGNLKAVIKIK